jgi:UDP-N-acetylmuramoyl-tripeptide--D-alanyl-D-alanine ligase
MKNIFKKIITFILQLEARLVIWRYQPKIIAITGSVGKTSTKDAVYAVLSKVAFVRKSEKSYNSEIGLPLTILGCANGWNNPFAWFKNIFQGLWLFLMPHKYPEWLILEVGVGKPGDMKRTAAWLKTNVVIMTMIGETPVHVEFFNSVKHLIEEKMGLIKTLKKDGFLILSSDDPVVLKMKTKSENRTITYGFNSCSDVLASNDSILCFESGEPAGITFKVDHKGNSLPVVIDGVLGKSYIYAALGALAYASVFKINMLNSVSALRSYDISPGRMRILKGINESIIIDDTYNSSPVSCQVALETLKEIKVKLGGRKIAVLGDMLELGKYTEEAHRKIGSLAKEIVDILILVGARAQNIKIGALEAGMSEENIFAKNGIGFNSHEAGEFLKKVIRKNDLVLVKGSQGMRMEWVVEKVILDQDNKSKLLVRQEAEWLKKK